MKWSQVLGQTLDHHRLPSLARLRPPRLTTDSDSLRGGEPCVGRAVYEFTSFPSGLGTRKPEGGQSAAVGPDSPRSRGRRLASWPDSGRWQLDDLEPVIAPFSGCLMKLSPGAGDGCEGSQAALETSSARRHRRRMLDWKGKLTLKSDVYAMFHNRRSPAALPAGHQV